VHVEEIPLSSIMLPDWDFRYRRDPAWLSLIISDVQRSGIRTPIVVYAEQGEPRMWRLVDGCTRVLAAKQLGLKTIPAVVLPHKPADPVEDGILRNIFQSDVDPISFAQALEYLLRKYMFNWEKVSSIVGLSEQQIRRYLKLLQLPDTVKIKIANREIPAFGEEVQKMLLDTKCHRKPKTGGSGVRCPICGRFPEKGRGKWLYLCEECSGSYELVAQPKTVEKNKSADSIF
jgi:ParB family chromosome partitioning protein